MSLAGSVAVAVPLLFAVSPPPRSGQVERNAPDPRLRAGVLLHDTGNYEQAISVYRSILKDRPHDAATVYELAFTMVSHGQHNAAIGLIEVELQSGVTQSPRLYALEAAAFDARGEPEKSEAALRKGLQADPANAELAYNLGVNLGTREKWAGAIDAFARCAAVAPENPSGWWGLGRSFEAVKDSSRAVIAYARAALAKSERARVKAAAQRVVALSSDAAALSRTLGDDPYFQEARARGHLDAVANELRRLGGDAAAELWCGEHSAEVDAALAWTRGR